MSRPKQSDAVPPKNRETPISRDIRYLKQLPPRARNERLSRLEELAMLDGIYHGLTGDQISAEHKMSTRTIRRFRQGLYDDPLSLFDLRVIGVGIDIYQCRVCGELRDELCHVQRHLLSHFFPSEVALNIDLTGIPELL